MPPPSLPRRLAAEGLATAFLLMAIVGSGIMAERLALGNAALALLANALATGAALYVLIAVFGPISGAQMNPAVTLVSALGRETGWWAAAAYVIVQLIAAGVGVALAHAMFDLPFPQISTDTRDGLGQWLAEFIATFGLVVAALGTRRRRIEHAAAVVALYITAAYWFTASTAFANPAVTLARTLTDSFTGIAPADAPGFLAAQVAGALSAMGIMNWLAPTRPIAR